MARRRSPQHRIRPDPVAGEGQHLRFQLPERHGAGIACQSGVDSGRGFLLVLRPHPDQLSQVAMGVHVERLLRQGGPERRLSFVVSTERGQRARLHQSCLRGVQPLGEGAASRGLSLGAAAEIAEGGGDIVLGHAAVRRRDHAPLIDRQRFFQASRPLQCARIGVQHAVVGEAGSSDGRDRLQRVFRPPQLGQQESELTRRRDIKPVEGQCGAIASLRLVLPAEQH
jgi:hypothetical protein